MFGCIQPMSSPMKSMFGFCSWATAGEAEPNATKPTVIAAAKMEPSLFGRPPLVVASFLLRAITIKLSRKEHSCLLMALSRPQTVTLGWPASGTKADSLNVRATTKNLRAGVAALARNKSRAFSLRGGFLTTLRPNCGRGSSRRETLFGYTETL
jgi:hypothetical protein